MQFVYQQEQKHLWHLRQTGKVYAWGDNKNKKIGIEEQIAKYAREVTNAQNAEGTIIQLPKIENIETRKKPFIYFGY